jgi:hypothetical protein
MSTALVLAIALIIAGGAFLYRNLVLLNNEEKLDHFLTHDRRGKREVAKYGMQKAKERIQTGYLKIGIAVSTALIVVGVLNLAKLAPTVAW